MERLQFKNESASCTLVRLENNVYSLRNLRAYKLGRGHATQLMKKVVSWADSKGVTLVLNVRATGRIEYGNLDDDQLIRFYEDHGFVVVSGNAMRREVSNA